MRELQYIEAFTKYKIIEILIEMVEATFDFNFEVLQNYKKTVD